MPNRNRRKGDVMTDEQNETSKDTDTLVNSVDMDADDETTGSGSNDAKSPAVPKRKHAKKRAVVWTVVAVVIVAVGVGFSVWHQQPSFCNAICHTPMDGYVTTYNEKAGQAGVDAYGNDISNTSSMLVVTHKNAGLTCLDCHESNLGQQTSEGMKWIRGDYDFPLAERSLEDLTSDVGNDYPDSFCLRSGCHDRLGISSRSDLIVATSSMARNPHSEEHGQVACSECHKAHRASTIYCSKCHSDAANELPNGWVPFSESLSLCPDS